MEGGGRVKEKSRKIFLLQLYKMVANKTECSGVEQRSILKFLVAKKCKPWEIYRRMWNVYGEVCFSKKIFTNRLNMSFPLRAWIESPVHEVETHTPVKKSFGCSGQYRHKKTHHYWFPATVNSVSYCQLLRQNSPYLLNDPRILWISMVILKTCI